jgi:hypothetical protein
MLLRPFLYDPTACASYLFGCGTHATLAVVDPHAARPPTSQQAPTSISTTSRSPMVTW